MEFSIDVRPANWARLPPRFFPGAPSTLVLGPLPPVPAIPRLTLFVEKVQLRTESVPPLAAPPPVAFPPSPPAPAKPPLAPGVDWSGRGQAGAVRWPSVSAAPPPPTPPLPARPPFPPNKAPLVALPPLPPFPAKAVLALKTQLLARSSPRL